MAKRKNREKKEKAVGLERMQFCPHCGRQVSFTAKLADMPLGVKEGYLVEHWFTKQKCANFPVLTEDLEKVLKDGNITDVLKGQRAEAVPA